MLQNWSLEGFKKSLDNDRLQIARELDRWRAATMPQQIGPPVMPAINPAIHLHFKKEFLKTEEAEQLATANPGVWQAMVQHIAMLEMAMQPAMPPAARTGPEGWSAARWECH